MLIFACIHSMELEIFAVSFPLMSRHHIIMYSPWKHCCRLFINFICLINFPKEKFPLKNNLSFFKYVPIWILKTVLQLRFAITCYFKKIIINHSDCHPLLPQPQCCLWLPDQQLSWLFSGCDILSCSSGWALRLPGQLDLLPVIHPLCVFTSVVTFSKAVMAVTSSFPHEDL